MRKKPGATHKDASTKTASKKVKDVPASQPVRLRRPFGKRLKKSVAARAVAKVEAILQAEKDKAKQAVERARNKVKEAAARKKQKARDAIARKKAAEQEAKARVRAEVLEEKARIREAAEREKEKVRLSKERARVAKLRAAQAAKKAKEEERARATAAKERASAAAQKVREQAIKARLSAQERRAREKEESKREKEQLAAERAREKEALARAKAAEKAAQRKEAAEQKEAQERAKAAEKAAQKKEAAEQKEALARAKAEEKAALARAREEQKEARAREKEAEKVAAQSAREQERQAREAERAQAKEALAQARARAAEEKQRAQAESLEKKKQTALAQKLEKEQKRELEGQLRDLDRKQEKALGGTLGTLVSALLDAIKARPDVVFTNEVRGPALSEEELLSWLDRLPVEALGFYREVGPLDLAWTLTTRQNSREISAEGRLFVPSPDSLEYSAADGYSLAGVPGDPQKVWSSLEEFFTRGARTLFLRTSDEPLDSTLRQSGAPRFTPAVEIEGSLKDKGLSDKAIRGLTKWLGSEIHLVLHATDTEEGRRRQEVLASAASGEEREVDLRLLDALNEGAPVQKKEWQQALAAHAQFLEAEGGDGEWTLHIRAGLPETHYAAQGDAHRAGQGDFSLECLKALKARGAKLASCNFTGVRGEELNLGQADLKKSILAYAWLEHARFDGADLTGCDFTGARLAGADFSRANLTETNFERADLRGANFAGAITSGTKFGGANVQNIKY